jgi:hypothetical protein
LIFGQRKYESRQETVAHRKSVGSFLMFHCCIASGTSGRRIEALKAYISVQPHGYIHGLLAEKCIPAIENLLLRAALFISFRMARSKIFPTKGAFDGE